MQEEKKLGTWIQLPKCSFECGPPLLQRRTALPFHPLRSLPTSPGARKLKRGLKKEWTPPATGTASPWVLWRSLSLHGKTPRLGSPHWNVATAWPQPRQGYIRQAAGAVFHRQSPLPPATPIFKGIPPQRTLPQVYTVGALLGTDVGFDI